MTLTGIYIVIPGPFRTAQKIHERGVVKENVRVTVALLYFKEGVERAEIDADVPIFQTKQKLNKLDRGLGVVINTCFDQNIVKT